MEEEFEYNRPIFNQFGEIIGVEKIISNFPLKNPKNPKLPQNHKPYYTVEEKEAEPITVDEVLDMHVYLRTFRGNFIKELEE